MYNGAFIYRSLYISSAYMFFKRPRISMIDTFSIKGNSITARCLEQVTLIDSVLKVHLDIIQRKILERGVTELRHVKYRSTLIKSSGGNACCLTAQRTQHAYVPGALQTIQHDVPAYARVNIAGLRTRKYCRLHVPASRPTLLYSPCRVSRPSPASRPSQPPPRVARCGVK